MKLKSLKSKITVATIVLVALSFLLSGIIIIGTVSGEFSKALLDKCIDEVTQIGVQAELLLGEGATTEDLQKFVTDTVENNEHIAYAIVIDKGVTAIAHSDINKIGKNYLDDPYTVDGAQEGKPKNKRFYTTTKECWTNDIMVPIKGPEGHFGAMDIGIYESATTSLIKQLVAYQTIILVTILVLVAIILYFICHHLFKPFNLVITKCLELGQGDFSCPVDSNLLERNDEIGSVAKALNDMQIGLIKIVTSTTEESGELVKISEEFSQNASKTQKASFKIATAVQDVVAGQEEQASFSEETVQMTNGIHQSIQHMTNNIENISSSAEQMVNNAQKGNELVLAAVGQMNVIDNKLSGASNQIELLGNKSKEIQGIVGLITNIAAQTNLLALNASIEAARAGEQGKGFAVVANEVGNLAKQSTESVAQIADILNEVYEDIQDVNTSINDGSSTFKTGLVSFEGAGEAFKDIIKHIDKVSTEIKEVSNATAEVNKGTGAVLEAVENIANISSISSEKVQEVAAMAQTQIELMDHVATSSKNLSHVAEGLSEQMKVFRV